MTDTLREALKALLDSRSEQHPITRRWVLYVEPDVMDRARALLSEGGGEPEARLRAFCERYRTIGVTITKVARGWLLAWNREYPDCVSDQRMVEAATIVEVVAKAEALEASCDAREPQHASPALPPAGTGEQRWHRKPAKPAPASSGPQNDDKEP